MSPSDLESLPPDLARLLESEKSRPDPPSDMRSRVLERIGAELFDVVPPAVPPDVTGSPSGASPSEIAPVMLRRLPLAVSLVTLGAVGGAALHASMQKPAPAPISLAAPVAAAPVAPAPAIDAATAVLAPPANVDVRPEPPASRRPARPTPPAVSPPPSAAVPTPPSPAASERERQLARDAALAAERALLEQARTALARGKPGDALGVLYRHERDFAHGQLVEEREALAILCLAADRQITAAHELAARFKQAHPKSMLLRAIDDALAAAP